MIHCLEATVFFFSFQSRLLGKGWFFICFGFNNNGIIFRARFWKTNILKKGFWQEFFFFEPNVEKGCSVTCFLTMSSIICFCKKNIKKDCNYKSWIDAEMCDKFKQIIAGLLCKIHCYDLRWWNREPQAVG